MSSKSAKSDIKQQDTRRSAVVENEEQRHSIANVPMQIPEGSFQVVPGIFVSGKAALPRLIEFFNVTHVVRCIETEPQQRALDKREAESQKKLYAALAEATKKNPKTSNTSDKTNDDEAEEPRVVEIVEDDTKSTKKNIDNNDAVAVATSKQEVDNSVDDDILITIGGTIAQPYGSGIPYPKNVFHCPIRDSIDESEFLPWARKASEFIANTLRIEEEDEAAIAVTEANQEQDEEQDANKKEDGGDDDGSSGRINNSNKNKQKKRRIHFDAFSTNSNNHANGNETAAETQNESHVHSETCGCNHDDNKNNGEDDHVENDTWAQFRERGPGAVVIHCEKGKSRAPAVAIAYLILKRQMTLQEALDMFDGDANEASDNADSASEEYELQLNPIFVLELAKLEAEVHGTPIFDLDGYWLQRLQHLFPKVPTATIARELVAAGGNMLVAREKLMGVAARQFFDRDALMVDALHNIMIRTVDEYRVAKNMRIPESAKTAADVVTKDECAKYFKDCEKKRDVALMKLTQLLKERMTIQ